jgi:methionine synthase II (cobalamin-independent)
MMNKFQNRNITSANATSILTVEELFPAGFVLEMYATDQSLSTENVQITETRQGVDGKMVAAYIPSIKVVTINFEPSSPSMEYIAQLADAMEAGKRIYLCHLQADIPSINVSYKYRNGVLQTLSYMPAHKKTLDPTTCVFHFESAERSVI